MYVQILIMNNLLQMGDGGQSAQTGMAMAEDFREMGT